MSSQPTQQVIFDERGSVNSIIIDQLRVLREEQREGFSSLRNEFNARIDKLVTQDAFTAEQRRVDARLAELDGDITTERRDREQAQQQQRSNVRWLTATVLTVVVPVGLFFASLVFGGN